VDQREGEHRYLPGEADFEHANLPEAQQHVDIAGEVDRRNNWKEPGEREQEHRDEVFAAAGMLFVELLQFSWLEPRGKLRKPIEAARRFAVASSLIRPELFADGKAGYQELGLMLRVTKQALSKIGREFQNCVGVHFRRSRRESSISHMRGAMLASHRRRRLTRAAH
jgi:hypothetical protein